MLTYVHERFELCRQFHYFLLTPGAVLRWDRRHLPPNLGLPPKCDIKHCLTNTYRCKKEHCVAFKIRQNGSPAEDPPRTPLEELTTLPRTSYLAREGTPLPIPYPVQRVNFLALGAHHLAPQSGSIAHKYYSLKPRLVNTYSIHCHMLCNVTS